MEASEHLARVGGRGLGEGQGRWERETGRGRRGDMEVREGRWGGEARWGGGKRGNTGKPAGRGQELGVAEG